MRIRSMAMLWLLLSLATAAETNAQPFDWQRCDTCYRNYTYTYGSDSTIVLGAIGVPDNLVDIAYDSLGVRLLFGYSGPVYLDTMTANNVAGRDSGAVNGMRRLLWRAGARGMTVMYPPSSIELMGKASCYNIESYIGNNVDSVQAFDCLDTDRQGRRDTTLLSRAHIWGWHDDSTSGGNYQMPSKPRFLNNGLARNADALTLLYALRDASLPGTQIDSSAYIRFTFTMSVNSAFMNNTANGISDTDVIAYGIVYRRDTTERDSLPGCVCARTMR